MKNKQNIKIACSGGSGFIASNIIRALNQQGYFNINIYDKLDTLPQKLHNILDLQFNGIYDYNTLPQTAVNYDWIIHAGACSATTTKPEDYEKVLEQNLYFTERLLKSFYYGANRYNKEDLSKKFIFASSFSVYGNADDFTERNNVKPPHLYGLTKLLVDRKIEQMINQGVNYIYSFRFTNVFGFDEKHKIERNMSSPISKFLIQEPPFTLFRDEKHTEFMRDFIFIEDLCKVILFTLENECKSGIYNLGCGQGTTWEELVQICAEARGLKGDLIQYAPLPENLAKQYQAKTVARIEKLRGELGYKGKFTPLRVAIQKIWDKMKE